MTSRDDGDRGRPTMSLGGTYETLRAHSVQLREPEPRESERRPAIRGERAFLAALSTAALVMLVQEGQPDREIPGQVPDPGPRHDTWLLDAEDSFRFSAVTASSGADEAKAAMAAEGGGAGMTAPAWAGGEPDSAPGTAGTYSRAEGAGVASLSMEGPGQKEDVLRMAEAPARDQPMEVRAPEAPTPGQTETALAAVPGLGGEDISNAPPAANPQPSEPPPTRATATDQAKDPSPVLLAESTEPQGMVHDGERPEEVRDTWTPKAAEEWDAEPMPAADPVRLASVGETGRDTDQDGSRWWKDAAGKEQPEGQPQWEARPEVEGRRDDRDDDAGGGREPGEAAPGLNVAARVSEAKEFLAELSGAVRGAKERWEDSPASRIGDDSDEDRREADDKGDKDDKSDHGRRDADEPQDKAIGHAGTSRSDGEGRDVPADATADSASDVADKTTGKPDTMTVAVLGGDDDDHKQSRKGRDDEPGSKGKEDEPASPHAQSGSDLAMLSEQDGKPFQLALGDDFALGRDKHRQDHALEPVFDRLSEDIATLDFAGPRAESDVSLI